MKIKFIHWSDSHGFALGSNMANACIDSADGLDFAIHTGDACQNSFEDDISYAQLSNSLFVLGNHDAVNRSGIAALPEDYDDWADKPTQEQLYNKFFKPNVAAWGVEMEANTTWWKKKFAEKGFMVIGLDSTVRDADNAKQQAWFQQTLEECVTENLIAVIASHIVEYRVSNPIVCNFSYLHYYYPLHEGGSWSDYTSWYPSVNRVMDIAETYVQTRGLKVACWLCGHEHADALFGHRSFPIVVCGSTMIDKWNNVARTSENYTARAVMNLCEYDSEQDTLTLWRLGADGCSGGNRRKMCCYSNKKKRVVSSCSR